MKQMHLSITNIILMEITLTINVELITINI